MFNVINRIEDKYDKTIVFFINKPTDIRFYIFGFYSRLKEYFEDDYNIVFVGAESKNNHKDFRNLYSFDKKQYDKLKKSMVKKKDDDNAANHNISLVQNSISVLKEIKNVEYLFIIDDSAMILPLQTWDKQFTEMKNELHDYVGSDASKIEKINEATSNIVETLIDRMSLLAYSQYEKIIYQQVFKLIFNNNRDTFKSFFGFVIDPIFFHPFFTAQNMPLKLLYFADDKRGTRNFDKFPIAELQHLVTDTQHTNFIKKHDFIFAGTILHDKGSRKEMWDLFFKHLKNENSSLYIPLVKNGIINDKTVGVTTKQEKAKESYKDLFADISMHELYKGHLVPSDISRETKKYKYSMVLRCISTNDSLNFRPIFYLNLHVLPFFDELYDPEYLQIPKQFQDRLRVKDSTDIDRLINYFNNNDDERLTLLDEMRSYYKIEEFKSNWKMKLDEFFK
jgi:hypothetical protein